LKERVSARYPLLKNINFRRRLENGNQEHSDFRRIEVHDYQVPSRGTERKAKKETETDFRLCAAE
jgi:hypothetical protein